MSTGLGFESWEELLAYKEQMLNEALARTTPRQWSIPAGGFVLYLDQHSGLLVVGRTLTVNEYVAVEQAYAEKEEGIFFAPAEREGQEAHQARGYLYGWWSSSIERGEWGSVHRAALICSITQEVYEGFLQEWEARPMPVEIA